MNKHSERKNEPPHMKPAGGSLPVFPELQDERWRRYLLLAMLAMLLTLIIIPKGGFIPDYYSPGDVAARDIKAPRDLLAPDLELTEKKQQEVRNAVPLVYDFDPRVGSESAELFVGSVLRVQTAASTMSAGQLLAETEQRLGSRISQEELTQLLNISLSDEVQQRLRQAIAEPFAAMVVSNLELLRNDRERGIVVRNLATNQEIPLGQEIEVVGIGKALQRVEAGLLAARKFTAPQRKAILQVLHRLLRPDLTYNQNETEIRRQAAVAEVKPVLFQIKKGEMIVREGERVSEEQIKKLKAISEQRKDAPTLRIAFGLVMLVMVLLISLHRFAKRNIRKYRPVTRDLTFLSLLLATLFLLLKVTIFVSAALEGAFPYIDSGSYFYLFPFAAGAMLVRIVLNSEIALVFSVAFALLVGILFGNSLLLTLYVIAGSLVGAHWVRHCTERSILYRAGLQLSLVNLLLVLGLHLLGGNALDLQLLFKLLFGFGNGLFCALVVTGTIPLVESIFKYTTDIKLLELANMNNPLLRELMVQAPGTYHHSVIVGNLVEAAAEEINANPLLARVAAYYHDVGKIRKPLYFIENTRGQENKHDKLAPSMSALILISHVKDGVELAHEHRLGDNLCDIIQQHHGTALMKYFYDKAKTRGAAEQLVDEQEYRYPGPKPQTREAALIMLADAVEAASRTLTDPTPARIQGMVQKIINNIFIDGQLDECELTLKDLHQIARSFNGILAGIFHNRIEYPEPAYRDREREQKRKNGEDTDRESTKEAKDRETPPAKGGSDDLKRLGMS